MIFAEIDWITKAPDIHSGPIRKMLKNSIALQPVSFTIIPTRDELRLNLVNNDLGTDQVLHLLFPLVFQHTVRQIAHLLKLVLQGGLLLEIVFYEFMFLKINLMVKLLTNYIIICNAWFWFTVKALL